MICTSCKTDAETRVLFTESVPNGRRRRRQCKECLHKFFTLETVRGMREAVVEPWK